MKQPCSWGCDWLDFCFYTMSKYTFDLKDFEHLSCSDLDATNTVTSEGKGEMAVQKGRKNNHLE